MPEIFTGIWKCAFGSAESITPVQLRQHLPDVQRLEQMPKAELPFPQAAVTGKQTARGYVVNIPLSPDEGLFGLGLQLLSINRTRSKKTMRVNSDPTADLGDSHAPVPFYVSTAGYAVLVDTARYATFYMGNQTKADGSPKSVMVEVPAAHGVNIYLFAGPTMLDALRRYVLFSGGGCLPPRWGLGVWYRPYKDFTQDEVLALAQELRAQDIPCDVLGPEPGWQSHAYSCSFAWGSRYPQPAELLKQLTAQHYRVNLWTHVFTHPTSPIYQDLLPYAGDYLVWNGLVPDLNLPEARRILAEQHARAHVNLGVSGYKLDECDNSDFNREPWSFPEAASFPSGADGEQMHTLLGMRYQETIEGIFRGRGNRTYGMVRSSGALAPPMPFVLYSDLYDHASYIRGMVSSGFSGLLWTPEVRHADSQEDLIRRLQTVILSPLAAINCWYIKNPPWKQWRRQENNDGRFVPDWETLQQMCRNVLRLRMQLLPYIYASFARYHFDGTPPFRALALDYPNDRQTWNVADQYIVGDRLLVAPMLGKNPERQVYLPAGQWFDFWTGEEFAGGQTIAVCPPIDQVPIYVAGADGAVFALAVPTLHTDDPNSFGLTMRIYGNGRRHLELYEDDGVSYGYEQGNCNWIKLKWDAQQQQGRLERTATPLYPGYQLIGWDQIQPAK